MKICRDHSFILGGVLFALVLSGCGSKPAEKIESSAKTTVSATSSGLEFKALKNAKDQRVYYIFDGKRHYVPSAATLDAIGLVKQVTSATDAEINRIPVADQLPSLTSNVIQASSGQVYVFENGKRRYVRNSETLRSMNIKSQQIQGVPNSIADAFPLGKPLDSAAHK